MLSVFGKNQGSGYDTGCQFETTLNNSDLGPLARDLNFKVLVDSFHGHAHRRLCQLSHLALYQKGLGLEDLGVCERAFSRSNPMGGVVRHMSRFHRQQAIVNYFLYTDDMETYPNLSMFFSLIYVAVPNSVSSDILTQ
jgi:Kyakuja-Dileera-Zisupton transposase